MKLFPSCRLWWLLPAIAVALQALAFAPTTSHAQIVERPGFEARQAGSAPSMRIVERTSGSLTYEVSADWSGRLADALRENLYATALEAVGGVPWLSEPIALPTVASPRVTILSSDFDEVALPFEVTGEDAEIVSGPAASVERVGLERRRPAGTLVVRLLQVDPDAGVVRRYHRMRVRIDFGMGQATPPPPANNPHLTVTESVLATGTWFKVPVTREGIYRIDRAFLSDLGLNPANIDPNRVKVFGNSGAPVPALNSAPRIPDLAENPVFVVGGGDGSFNEGDGVYFFGRAASGWNWFVNQTGTFAEWQHYINVFSQANYYFIRVDGPAATQISTAAPPAGTPTVLDRVSGRIVIEEDLPAGMVDREGGGSGLDWLGRDLTPARNRITVLDTLPPDLGQGTIQYRGRFAARSPTTVQMAFMRGNSEFAGASLAGSSGYRVFWPATVNFEEPATANQPLRVDLRMTGGSGSPIGWIDYIRAIYPQNLRAHEDYLRFATPGWQSGVFEFVLTGFSGEPQVWDVTEVGQTRRLQVTSSGNTHRVRVRVDDPHAPREIVAFRPSSSRMLRLDGELGEEIPNQNLHGIDFHPDYVIVTAEPFMEAAQELADFRAADGLTPLVVDIREIYNEFSGGQVDPRGLRDFLRFTYDRSPGAEPVLRYAVLFGDGNYDYRGLRPGGFENNFVPTYQSEESADGYTSFTSDDYFGLLSPNEGVWAWSTSGTAERVDIGIGRIPVRTAEEASDMVAKIRRYEDPSTDGAWRTRYTLLSDDHLPNHWDTDLHVQNSELVADTARARAPDLNFDKIYLSMYRLQQTGVGARRPDATASALRALEEGTLVWNYSGHGGPNGLSDVRLISRDEIRQLNNADRLTIAITATCAFGRYDLRDDRSAGEEFFLNPRGGAAAIFTTSRVVFAGNDPAGSTILGQNITLNRMMFQRDAQGRPLRLGDIYQRTKAHDIGAGLHNRKFNLLGDPAMRFGLPEREVRVTRINDIAVGGDDLQERTTPQHERLALPSRGAEHDRGRLDHAMSRADGIETRDGAARPEQQGSAGLPELRALELATIEGDVLDPQGQPDPSFSGEVEVLVYDVERTFTLPPEVERRHTDGTFRARTDLIYRGRATVSGGQWQVEFIVPRDVSYAGASARVGAYVAGGGLDGSGYTEEVLISTESGPPIDDNQGPHIRLFLNDTTFVSGGLSGNEPLLIARLSDDSGINMAGVGVGHEMLLVINGNEAEAINVGHFYQSDLDTFRSGSLRYRLPPLDPGPNTISLTAWDVVNNSSTAHLDFIVEDANVLRIEHAYPYPNPTTGPTRFVFEHNQAPGTPATVQIRIFSLNGRPIRTLDGPETLPDGVLTGSPVQIPWDGRDEDMDQLATGIYLYRVRVEVDLGDGERRVAERIERLAIIR